MAARAEGHRPLPERLKNRMEQARCKHCSAPFQRIHSGHPRVYCSPACRAEAKAGVVGRFIVEGLHQLAADNDLGAYYLTLKQDCCAYCGGSGGAIDHIVPRVLGGENHWTNYTGACTSCNSSKHARPLLAFLGFRLVAREMAGWQSLIDGEPCEAVA